MSDLFSGLLAHLSGNGNTRGHIHTRTLNDVQVDIINQHGAAGRPLTRKQIGDLTAAAGYGSPSDGGNSGRLSLLHQAGKIGRLFRRRQCPKTRHWNVLWTTPELAEVICQRDRALATLIEQIGVEEVREILAYYERFGLGGFGPQANRRDELDDINLNDLLG